MVVSTLTQCKGTPWTKRRILVEGDFGVIGRIAGVVWCPRATLAALVRQPTWVATWLLILIVWAICGAWLLSSDVGRQALIDERVRVVEAFGGTVTDDEYAALLANPPWWVYFTSGGRLLLTPEVTLLIAVALWATARFDGASITPSQALSVAVHASIVLLLGQLIATPLHYVRESLTSPLNLAAVLPLMEEGTVPARFFGTLDLFAIWWAALLAMGLSVLTKRRTSRYLVPLAGVYLGFAGLMAAIIAATGGA